MSALARYTGPLGSWRGAIGRWAYGGAVIAGRLVLGSTERPDYVLEPSGVAFDSWHKAAVALSAWLESRDAGAAAFIRSAPVSEAGVEVVVDDVRYRLTVV